MGYFISSLMRPNSFARDARIGEGPLGFLASLIPSIITHFKTKDQTALYNALRSIGTATPRSYGKDREQEQRIRESANELAAKLFNLQVVPWAALDSLTRNPE